MAEIKRSSLVDDSFESVGSKKPKKSSGGSKNGLKLGLAIGCLIAAGALFAYSQGMFEAPPKPVVRTVDDEKAMTESQKAADVMRKSPAATVGGS